MEEKSAFAVEAFKANQNGVGPIKGSFENSYYNNSNGLSHACAIMGLAAAKINLEDADWKSQGVSPLDRYYNDGQPVAVPSEQPIIALSGLMTQSNVWIDQQLTVSKVNTLLAEARKCTGDSHYGQKISDGIEVLTEALGEKTSGALAPLVLELENFYEETDIGGGAGLPDRRGRMQLHLQEQE